jgi:hypothetical protein
MVAHMSRLWLRITQTAALCSLLAILASLLILVFLDASGHLKYSDLIPLILSSPFWLPYLGTLWNLRVAARSQPRPVKKGLALAISWGGFIFLLSAFRLFEMKDEADHNLLFAAGIALMACLQIFLIFAAVKTYYSMERAPADWRILATRLTLPAAALVFCAVIIPYLLRPLRPGDSVSLSSLRTISTAQIAYANDHPNEGFATSLNRLGPAPGAGLIDALLASGIKSGIIITLIAAPPDANGRVTKYTVTARPQHFERGESRSFFTDESCTIRYTTEDRTPTAEDPRL